MKLRNKILLILLFVFGLFIICGNESYCASGDVNDILTSFTINDYNYIFPVDNSNYSYYLRTYDNFDYHYIFYTTSNSSYVSFDFFSSTEPFYFYREGNFDNFSVKNDVTFNQYHLCIKNNSTTLDGDSLHTNCSFSANDIVFGRDYRRYYCCYASVNVLDFYTDELVFREAGCGNSAESGGGNTGNTVASDPGNESTNTVNNTNTTSGNTGGGGSFNGTGSSSSFEEDDTSSGWGIVESILNFIRNIFNGIGNIVSLLGQFVDYLLPNPLDENDSWIITDIFSIFADLIDYLLPNPSDNDDVWIVTDLIDLLGNLLRSLFIPNNNYFSNQYSDISDRLDNKIHFRQHYEALEAINNNISQGGQTNIDTFVELPEYRIADGLSVRMLRFIDFSFLGQYRDTWFAWCRVVFYLMIVIYNLSQILKFLNGHTVVEGSNQIQGVSSGGKHTEGVGKH